jgi:hypothetical protein
MLMATPISQFVLWEPETDNLNTLGGFLDETSALFDNMTGAWCQILIVSDLRQPLQDAWQEARTQFDELKNAVSTPSNFEILRKAGLADKQWRLKWKALQKAWKRFAESGTVKFLKKVLGWINMILGSLASVLGGAGEGLKELKESIELLIESFD